MEEDWADVYDEYDYDYDMCEYEYFCSVLFILYNFCARTISLHKKCRGPQSLKLYFLKSPSGLQTPKLATTKNHKILTSKAGIKRPWLKYVAIANILPS